MEVNTEDRQQLWLWRLRRMRVDSTTGKGFRIMNNVHVYQLTRTHLVIHIVETKMSWVLCQVNTDRPSLQGHERQLVTTNKSKSCVWRPETTVKMMIMLSSIWRASRPSVSVFNHTLWLYRDPLSPCLLALSCSIQMYQHLLLQSTQDRSRAECLVLTNLFKLAASFPNETDVGNCALVISHLTYSIFPLGTGLSKNCTDMLQ